MPCQPEAFPVGKEIMAASNFRDNKLQHQIASPVQPHPIEKMTGWSQETVIKVFYRTGNKLPKCQWAQ